MPRPANYQSINAIIEEAVSEVVARLSRTIADAMDKAAASGAPARAVTARSSRSRRRTARRSRPRGEMTRWVADRNARRVPTFVIEATGLDTKKKIVAKFGENAAFAKGKALPPPVAGGDRSMRVRGKEAGRAAPARPPLIRKESATAG